jgi:hypothetical protein
MAITIIASSIVIARAGVARPDLDVMQFIVRRTSGDMPVPPISVGASLVQFVLSIAPLPLVKVVPPSAFYRPEIGASWQTLVGAAVVAVASLVAAGLSWRGRLDVQAPREQQREAEEFA